MRMVSISSDCLPRDSDCWWILSLLLFNPDRSLALFSFFLSSTVWTSNLVICKARLRDWESSREKERPQVHINYNAHGTHTQIRERDYPENAKDASNISYADSRKSSSDNPSRILKLCISLLKDERKALG